MGAGARALHRPDLERQVWGWGIQEGKLFGLKIQGRGEVEQEAVLGKEDYAPDFGEAPQIVVRV